MSTQTSKFQAFLHTRGMTGRPCFLNPSWLQRKSGGTWCVTVKSGTTWCLTEVSQVWALVSAWDSKKLHNMVSHKMKAVEGESLNNLLLSLMSAPMSTLWNYKIFEYISFPTLDDQPDKSSLLCMDVIGNVWNFWECGTFVSIIAITTGENVGSHQVRHMT